MNQSFFNYTVQYQTSSVPMKPMKKKKQPSAAHKIPLPLLEKLTKPDSNNNKSLEEQAVTF